MDLFSGHAASYARYRIDYPAALFEYVLRYVPDRQTAWDCATGNGQAAVALADHFAQVEATDISRRQLENATQRPNITYRICPAESTPFAEAQFDLITVGQALHWFDVPAFHAEANRALKPTGVLAEWGYGLNTVSVPIDEVLQHLYHDVLGPYWNPMRRHIETEYRQLDFPFTQPEYARFEARREWSLDEYLNYLRTWSAVQTYITTHGHDPVEALAPNFARLWGQETRLVRFPIFLRLGKSRG